MSSPRPLSPIPPLPPPTPELKAEFDDLVASRIAELEEVLADA